MEYSFPSITFTSNHRVLNCQVIKDGQIHTSSSTQSLFEKRKRRRWQPAVSRASAVVTVIGVIFILVMNVAVVPISIGEDHQQRRFLRRHQLLSPNYQLLDSHVRYLTLGGPSTWGEGLEVASNAYPYQLSNQVQNVADSAPYGSPTPASLCTQSIVGDHNYDVVTLEYETYETSSLELLTRRLRERFPVATIVFVKLWTPLDLFYFDTVTSQKVSFGEWRLRRVDPSGKTTKESIIRDMKNHIWMFDSTEKRDRALDYTMSSIDGIVYRLPVPSDINQELDVVTDRFVEIESSKEANSASLRYTLSRQGHFMVAKGLEAILRHVDSPRLNNTLYSSGTTVASGTWGSGDSCQFWYETGKGMPREHSRSLKYKVFSNHYALEVTAPGASLSVHNPFEEDRMVYLTYLTTSAGAGSKKVYPRTKVHFENDPSNLVLDPSHDDNLDMAHRTRTSAVGMVKAQSTVELIFTPLEEYTLNGFRVVGVSFLAKEKVTHAIPSEFAMLPHGLHIEEEEEEEGTTKSTHHGSFDFWWSRSSISYAVQEQASSDES